MQIEVLRKLSSEDSYSPECYILNVFLNIFLLKDNTLPRLRNLFLANMTDFLADFFINSIFRTRNLFKQQFLFKCLLCLRWSTAGAGKSTMLMLQIDPWDDGVLIVQRLNKNRLIRVQRYLKQFFLLLVLSDVPINK